MINEIDILKETLIEYKKALRLKNMNQELIHHLHGSLFWLLRYSEKYSIPLPQKEALSSMIEKTDFLIDEIFDQPSKNRDKNNRRFDRTDNS